VELAAARIKLLRGNKLRNGWMNRFQLLTGGERTALPRTRPLAALIDWSHELLTETGASAVSPALCVCRGMDFRSGRGPCAQAKQLNQPGSWICSHSW
jgi:predicted ATPase